MNRKVKHRLLSLLLGIVIFTIPLSKATYSQVLSLENMFPLLSTISLTEKQQIQLEQLSQETVLKIKNVLTPPQQTQFFQGIEAGKDYRESLGPINMSEVQKEQFRNIVGSVKTQVYRTLTLQQKLEIQRRLSSQGN
ncbi:MULTISPECIES: hypothetical protein [Crocosphaera]|uniref:Bicyclomycin resistance protein n=4 Tax=Crocosphaera watsonii TaxID=263511 RepID=T2JKI4_CROWT|nr:MULTISPECIES: hypothetical protein [Crocosphaera]MCH2244866.1 hypothetical protein [Crocosphaera sp.]CCQ65770.1 Bicyclomycin resistance protein [Crocosphaera watsonii WH 0402]